MNAVGIDVSKGKSMVAVMKPLGETVATPFEVGHTIKELSKLAEFLKGLHGETRIVMEYTGRYFLPIANFLYNQGFFVSVVNSLLVHDYGTPTIRKVKTDRKDALKLAAFALDRWIYLSKYVPEEDIRMMLKTYNRQYNQYIDTQTALKNNLTALLDQTLPGVSGLFSSPPRRNDRHEKWLDFSSQFWHIDCICGTTVSSFMERYRRWCQKSGYRYSSQKAESIYTHFSCCVYTLPPNNSTKLLIIQAIRQINAIAETLSEILREMQRLSSKLPEYPIVMEMYGIGNVLGPQLMAEIGDIRRFYSKKALVAYAGIDAPPYQSGTFASQNRSISKRGPAALRRVLFQIMKCILQTGAENEPIYQFLDKKRNEGKHYYVYLIAGANKFLRIYYARVKSHLEMMDNNTASCAICS